MTTILTKTAVAVESSSKNCKLMADLQIKYWRHQANCSKEAIYPNSDDAVGNRLQKSWATETW